MEEIISQYKGWVSVFIYKIKKTDHYLYESIAFYIDSELKSVKLLQKLIQYKSCLFIIQKGKEEKLEAFESKLPHIFKETSSDLCLLQKDNCLFIRDFHHLNLAIIGEETCLVIYPHGLSKVGSEKRSSFDIFYYIIPVVGLIVFLYFIEREIERRERNKKLLI